MADATVPEVEYQLEGPLAVLTLNRPQRRNAVNGALADALRSALQRAEADAAVRVAVLTGAGDVFCAGADLREFAENGNAGALWTEGGFAGFVRLPRSKPVIAAVNGPAIAGGFEIALACDLIVADESSYFELPEPSRGLFAAAGAALRLPRRLPYHVAMEILLLGNRLTAVDAQRWGLVNRLSESGGALREAMTTAAAIVRQAPLPIQATLDIARRAQSSGEDDLWMRNDESIRRINASADAQEGARAFLEHRRPVWRGV
jgi:enoyl-CoA hydratase